MQFVKIPPVRILRCTVIIDHVMHAMMVQWLNGIMSMVMMEVIGRWAFDAWRHRYSYPIRNSRVELLRLAYDGPTDT